MNRRQILISSAALALTAGSRLRAEDSAGGVSPEARALYEKAMVFDANLAPPISDKLPFPPELIAMVRDSGVNAVKTSLAGTDSNFEDTVAEIAFVQRMIEYYPDVFLQIRQAS